MSDGAPTAAAGPPAAEAAAELCAAEPAKLSEEDARAIKRKEIEEKVAAMKLLREKEAEQKTNYFGEHPGITCDGCGVGPIFGYRYHCKSCANHDVCEACFDAWQKGSMKNQLNKQTLSSNASDHNFVLHKDKTFKASVKGGGSGLTAKQPKQPKPNDPCTCGSGKKYKKCCGCGKA